MGNAFSICAARLALLVSTGLLLCACDRFPENAGVTLLDDGPALVYQHCGEEAIHRIAIYEYDGSGQGDDNYTLVSEFAPADGLAQLVPLDPPAVGVQLDAPTGYRIVVHTSKVRAIAFFRPDELQRDMVEWNGKYLPIDDFLRRTSVC